MMVLLGPSFNLLLFLAGLLALCKKGDLKLAAGNLYQAVKGMLRRGVKFFNRARSAAGEK